MAKQDNDHFLPILLRDGYLKTPRIIEAFRIIDRKDFVSEEYKNEAYKNYPLPIGYNQTISQPLTVAFMMELLGPKSGEKILDIGSGSGWQAALLAYCVQGTEPHCGKVITLERILSLKNNAEKNIAKYNFLEKGIVEIIHSDGIKGYNMYAPYDKIIAGACTNEIPSAWKEQLVIGGKIVVPHKESIIVLEKQSPREFIEQRYFGFHFVPLLQGTVDNSSISTT